MSAEEKQDKTIVCVDCEEEFVFTAGEQQFYEERGLAEVPKRCKPCRTARRRRLGRRRRTGGASATEGSPAAIEEQGHEGGEIPEESAAESEARGSEAPRTFWDDRPEWVREAMAKTSPNGSDNGDVASSGSNGQGSASDGKRRRRRRSRRRSRKKIEGTAETPDKNSASADGGNESNTASAEG